MQFLEQDIQPLGLGCWPIGGKMLAADGLSLGYSNSDDKESISAIQAAVSNGITVFDTAAAYGAGHSERLLGKALKHNKDALIATKIGIAIDEETKTLLGEEVEPDSVIPAIERCLTRLDRDTIDLLLLHANELPVTQASAVFEQMDIALKHGKIRSFGWSTDFTDSVNAVAKLDGFTAVEYAMHVLMDAPSMQQAVNTHGLTALIRSPLAMGLLSGKYNNDTSMPKEDIRATNQGWMELYIDGKPNPVYVEKLQSVRELLETEGRSTVQGALAWLWAKSPSNIPIPGARTVEQVEGLANALAYGPLSQDVMVAIDELVGTENISDGRSSR